MKAAQIRKYGSSEVVDINKNAPVPVISQGQILVEVYAAGVNPVDWKIREGYMKEMVPLIFPATLGGDFSGVVIETGAGVSEFKKGDEVFGQASALRGGSGSFAEFVSTDTKVVSRKPRKVDHMKAAALPLVGVSAWQALVEHIGLSKGKKILIHGGAGGIGTMAIQLAKYLGAYVATTVNARDMEYARELGADEAIDYKNQSFEKILHDYDAIFDTVGGETYARSFAVLKKGGIIVSMLEQPRPDLMKKYGVNAIAQFTQVNNERLSRVAELADKNILKAQIEKTFPLEKAREALEYLQTGHPRGKVVLKIK
ncbi:MAG: NADP-dependent oxidoreductase [Candidatus Methanoperedens sp.]|nr:NADP-dependent oxidoreductase [Candidatus Methanoperedens sp.]